MLDVIHVDEKWFYITRDKRRYYLHPDEDEPHRQCKNKRFITKVMFLAAVARPRWDTNKNKRFDGKLGIWPFIKTEISKRKSRNRPAGVPETKAIEKVTNVEYREFLIEKLLPAIKNKFPSTYDAVSYTHLTLPTICSV